MITNDIPNGTIFLASNIYEPILVISVNGLGHWGYSLTYGSNWLAPCTQIPNNFITLNKIPHKYIFKAKLKLRDLFDNKFMSNLDYIEALAKLKEYEKEKT